MIALLSWSLIKTKIQKKFGISYVAKEMWNKKITIYSGSFIPLFC